MIARAAPAPSTERAEAPAWLRLALVGAGLAALAGAGIGLWVAQGPAIVLDLAGITCF